MAERLTDTVARIVIRLTARRSHMGYSRSVLPRPGASRMRQLLFPLIFGIAAIALGICEYYDLLALETQGGTRKVHTVIKLLYETAGKWGVLGFFVAVGTIALGYVGVRLVRRPRDS